MKQYLKTFLTSALFCSLSSMVFGANLLSVYHDALQGDPTFKQAEGILLATKENLPQARAVLLPQLELTDEAALIKSLSNGISITNQNVARSDFTAKHNILTIGATQTLFNYTNFKNLNIARAIAQAADAEYEAAAQNLVMRVATAYFNVLLAQDIVQFDRANKRALARQLDQTREQYKVGLKTIKDLYEVKASYETAVARLIADQNAVADNYEALTAITGEKYLTLAPLRNDLPLVKPTPPNITRWVNLAMHHNLILKADCFKVFAARENIQSNFGGHLPTLALFAEHSRSVTKFHNVKNAAINKDTRAGVNLVFPIYTGGLVNSQVKQAKAEYLQALATQQFNHRQVVASTRQDYLGVISVISQIEADKQSMISSQSALKAARAEFQAGTATMLDVLTQQSNVLDAQSNYARDLYAYVNDTIKLKEDVGLLSLDDVIKINSWLSGK